MYKFNCLNELCKSNCVSKRVNAPFKILNVVVYINIFYHEASHCRVKAVLSGYYNLMAMQAVLYYAFSFDASKA